MQMPVPRKTAEYGLYLFDGKSVTGRPSRVWRAMGSSVEGTPSVPTSDSLQRNPYIFPLPSPTGFPGQGVRYENSLI